jgi:microcystin degradation protein MlrC
MRIVAGGIAHETSTCAPTRTALEDFEAAHGVWRGPAVLAHLRGTNICTGGFIEAADRHGFELVPLLWTAPFSSGLIERPAYEALKGELLGRLREARAAGPVDGALLDQHGSMVVEGIDDADGDLIESVR